MNARYDFNWILVHELATYLKDKGVANKDDAEELATEMLDILDEGLERALQEKKLSDGYIRW